MPHWCRICDRMKSNESFSGKGHATHVCKACKALPKEERDAIEQQDEIFHYLKQSHISPKNVARLRKLAESPNPQTASHAQIVLDVALIKPYKRRRLKYLASVNPHLLNQLEETGLIYAHHW